MLILRYDGLLICWQPLGAFAEAPFFGEIVWVHNVIHLFCALYIITFSVLNCNIQSIAVRVRGSLQDQVVYDVGSLHNPFSYLEKLGFNI